MTTQTTDQGLIIPVNGDVNNFPTATAQLVGSSTGGASGITGVESRLVKRYLSVSDRAARNPTPATGELSVRADAPGKFALWIGVSWLEYAIPYTARQTLSGTLATVTFSGIPSNLRSLKVRHTARGDAAVSTQYVFIQINGSAAAVYNSEVLSGTNATASAGPLSALTAGAGGAMTGASAPANAFGSSIIEFMGWDAPHSPYLQWQFSGTAIGTGLISYYTIVGGGQFTPAGPYTSLTLYPQAGNFIAGSDFQLEGEYA